jgi:NAD(P)-dependent dehydrogenase (short-subunit alcohol dehydrogenase family)
MPRTRHGGWTAYDIPDQSGRIAIVTGANTGLGKEAAHELARHGAHVILACRSVEKGEAALEQIQARTGNASAEVMKLDLGSLESIRAFAEGFLDHYDRLDILINNAGVMFTPYGMTEDGFEQQLGVNHLGHFALTGLLLERILETPGSRIVNVSSGGHRMGSMDFDDLQWKSGRYQSGRAYGRSKLANLLFTYELQRRLQAANESTIALAAHPGGSNTDLARHVEQEWYGRVLFRLAPLFMQDAAAGALPELRAATDPAAIGGQYYGPDGFLEQRGSPVVVKSNARSYNADDAARLWQVSEELTGVRFERLDAPAMSVAA